MNDRFKVRMWDSKYKKMWDTSNDGFLETIFECLKQQIAFDDGLKCLEKVAYNHNADGRIFMQCTGLKDKNGKLIYEGDVVKIRQDIPNCIIVWFDEDASFSLKSTTSDEYYPIYCYDGFEIIGNIHENKDLLE